MPASSTREGSQAASFSSTRIRSRPRKRWTASAAGSSRSVRLSRPITDDPLLNYLSSDHDDCSDEIQRALRTLSDVGIAIYPVDSRGVMGAFETTSQEPRLHTFPAETARKR